ncbi:MAG: hypothetical protein J0I93_05325 [Legionella sp.]|nr:hypothetical protein [Legionella sp.]
MRTFFEKKTNSSPRITKNSLVKEKTASLFAQLEEGYTQYTNIFQTIKDGADLFTPKPAGDFAGFYPIHVAALNATLNLNAVREILKSFDNPDQRKEYIFLRGPDGRNILEILLVDFLPEEDVEITPVVLSILSYLTPQEQQDLISSLSPIAQKILDEDENEVLYEEEIVDLTHLNYFFKNGNFISMCDQRSQETYSYLEDSDSDSGEESLGRLHSVSNKKFTARVSYREIIEENMVVRSIPELSLIPSDWRLDTAIQGSQGDHVTAYILLLSSFAHCEGECIKKLPKLIYDLTLRALPAEKENLDQVMEKNIVELNRARRLRKTTIAALKKDQNLSETFIVASENHFKKTEIALIATQVENMIDDFIGKINKLEHETFSQARKSSLTKSYRLNQLCFLLDREPQLQDPRLLPFKKRLIQVIQHEMKNNPEQNELTDETLKDISKALIKGQPSAEMLPPALLANSKKLTQKSVTDFLKKHTPFKKYHEGHAIKDIKAELLVLKKTQAGLLRKKHLSTIGFYCSKLFDYPRVADINLNNESVLYQAIARHWILINAAFKDLQALPGDQKIFIFSVFLEHILFQQGWCHQVIKIENQYTELNLRLLIERVYSYVEIDDNFNFWLKPEYDEPSPETNMDVRIAQCR